MDGVSEVKSRLNIEDVVGEYVSLKRAGRNFKGLSPFTNEKTPSFIVSPEKQIWHDFSSGRGGDVFTFIQEVEGLDFSESLELLARKAGVDLEQYKSKSNGPKIDKENLFKAVDLAVNFYQKQLLNKKEALDYIIKKRNLSRQTIIDFKLGYSPNQSDSLRVYLQKKGYKDSDLTLAGLVSSRQNKYFDMFRGRIMVPLYDHTGRAVGFTARILDESNGFGPKYINTSSTPLYDKSRQLFGLHMAKEAIRNAGFSVVVEGNMDVITSHQADVKMVVASAGTALTEFQLKSLSRFSADVRLAFDQDRAGIEATERAIPIASKVGVNLKIITLPSGKDPDELIQKDPQLWTSAIEKADYAVDWLINLYRKNLDLNTAEGKKKFSDVIVGVIKNLTDPVEQDHYLRLTAQMSGVDISALKQKLENSGKNELKKPLKKVQVNIQPPKENLEIIKTADRLLSLVLMLPGTRSYLNLLTEDMMPTNNQKNILKFIKENPEFDASPKELSRLKKYADNANILILQFEELYKEVDTLELQYEAARLRAKIIENFVKQQKIRLSGELQTTDEKSHQQILNQVKDLDILLNKIKDS